MQKRKRGRPSMGCEVGFTLHLKKGQKKKLGKIAKLQECSMCEVLRGLIDKAPTALSA